MKSKVIASSYFTTVTADSLAAYGKIKKMESETRQKAQLISGIVQFVKYEYIDIPDDNDGAAVSEPD